MTHEKSAQSVHVGAFNEAIDNLGHQHHAPNEKTTMSSHGPFDPRYTPSHRLSGDWLLQKDDSESEVDDFAAQPPQPTPCSKPSRSSSNPNEPCCEHRPTKRARIHFCDFAAQARLQQHHEHRRRLLSARRRVLQRSIALSTRLRRTSSWVQDGLVEISRHQDAAGFARVFGHAQDLVDICYSHWNNDLQALDTIQSEDSSSSLTSGPSPFFDQLARPAQNDLLDLLSNLRSSPQFLIDRFRNLPRSQVATLTSKPRWEADEPFLAAFSQDSGRSSQRQKRTQAYSRNLEDYASSFERSNPLSFLLHNLYGHGTTPDSSESRLRLFTWSTVLARLLETGADSYNALYWQVLEAFSVMQEWPAKTRLELFLTDLLQRGAVLLDVDTTSRSRYDRLNTEQAHEFFEDAVVDLYWLLIECRAGLYPTGALDLAQAILGKLTHPQAQSDFRSHFFHQWYINHFLKAAIMFPENENMLLKVHVSKRARECVLAPLFNKFAQKFENFFNEPITTNDINIRNMIEDMISMLEDRPAANPYETEQNGNSKTGSAPNDHNSIIVLCASEVVKVLEILSPQAIHSPYGSDPVMRELRYAFQATARPNTRFDMLKQELLQQAEPGTSAKDIHPCIETWTEFQVIDNGSVTRLETVSPGHTKLASDETWNLSQQAAIRLCTISDELSEDVNDDVISRWNHDSTLSGLFEQQIRHCQAETRTVEYMYWKKALEQLHREYPSTKMIDDDTIVLSRPLQQLQKRRETSAAYCALLEDSLVSWEKAYQNIKRNVRKFMSGLEELRLKLWYTSEILNSSVYADARSIAKALSHMSIRDSQASTSSIPNVRAPSRPGSSRSGVSSIFGQRRNDTIELLKAPSDQGGWRKLADGQIESIKRWLRQYGIDNFCKGEERFHRFCMEIHLIAKRLTGDNIVESEELWASDLFQRERSFYDYSPFGISSAPASTRPVSVFSDSFSAPYPVTRPATRSPDSDIRSTMSDERGSLRRGSVYSMVARTLNPQLLTPELASSMSSYGRASSATTTTSEVFSAPLSIPSRSVTEASVYSRAPSMLHGRLPNFAARSTTSVKEKRKFREQLRKGLVCLLLSDLGCIVWSWGCETDTWIRHAQENKDVMTRCMKRITTKSLRSDVQTGHTSIVSRRRSITESVSNTDATKSTEQDTSQEAAVNDPYFSAFRDIMDRLSQHIDPVSKLQACQDFDTLALQQLDELQDGSLEYHNTTGSEQPFRRNSLDSYKQDLTSETLHNLSRLSVVDASKPSHDQIVHHYKRQLAKLQPKTIFRDLQYIAVFTPSEMLDKTPAGKAFMHLGMAALDYKNELCSSMVDLADKMMVADMNRETSLSGQTASQPLSTAAKYWMIAAVEGNSVAQRELAMLYLMQPEMLPILTRPLWSAADVFRDENMWQKATGGRTNSNDSRQALCLALHWMQQAATNGDEIAQRKLEERKGKDNSIR